MLFVKSAVAHAHAKKTLVLIGGDDISNDVTILGTCFSMFVYIRARFPFALIGGNLTAQSTGEPQENWRWNSNSRDVVASPPSFSRPAARAPRRACSQAASGHRKVPGQA